MFSCFIYVVDIVDNLLLVALLYVMTLSTPLDLRFNQLPVGK